ncbi:Arylsulfatase A [Lutibacter oricola]|uniref:Arylsulfatase A n=1 Tax=Lutibacter oricola TaxID=762486 RepID=A0A1H2SDI4_9FLAO|nr:sulfatase [Lutibacter oricola]SDW29670.1 Arylsulfatase A [Lutibacter oricola]
MKFKEIIIVVCFLLKLTLITGQERPNIIFLFSDDQTINTVGAYGNKEIITPNLDKLANKGVMFTNHYNTTSICMASRVSVLTGLYEYRHGTNFGHGDLDRKLFDESYPVKLKKAGYYTGFVGKMGFNIKGQNFIQFDNDFDEFAGGPGQTSYETSKNKKLVKYANKYPHATRANGAWSKNFIKNATKTGKPFCLSVSFKAPHRPVSPDPIDLKKYESIKTFSKPINFGVENGEHLSKQSHTSRAANQYRYWITDYNKSIREYYALITGVDAAVGMILETLKEEGLDKNTIVIFTSDNGYNCGAHGFAGKVLPYEEGSKSPLIIYDPRLPKKHQGKVSNALTGNIDIAATIFDISGLPVSKNMDGKSLIPLLKKPTSKVREFLPLFNFWGVSEAHSMAVVTPELKYVYWNSGNNNMKSTEELFNLEKDPFEMKNIANEDVESLNKMKSYYSKELKLLENKLIKGNGYENFPTIFNPNISWEEKRDLVKSFSSKKKKKTAKN